LIGLPWRALIAFETDADGVGDTGHRSRNSMPRKKVGFDTVRRLALELPGVAESTTYGSPCFKARGKLLTCIAIHRSAEPESLAVRVDLDSRAEMIADDPEVYYLTDHYVDYPFVLVRMKCIQPEALKDLLAAAWRLATADSAKGRAMGPMRKPKGRRKI
jgi:hypothetical protein